MSALRSFLLFVSLSSLGPVIADRVRERLKKEGIEL
jgi:hypothetical protein